MKHEDKNCAYNRILVSAVSVFSEKGFDGARVDEIAKRAKVNKALMYYYFESKENLLQEIIKNYIDHTVAEVDDILNKVDTLDKQQLQKIFEQMVKTFESKKDILRILIIEAFKSGQNDFPTFDIFFPMFGKIVEKFKDKGLEISDPISLMIFDFFYTIIPLTCFFTIGQKWAEYHNIKPDEMKNKFLSVLKNNYEGYFDNILSKA